jgi:hypothetical protein
MKKLYPYIKVYAVLFAMVLPFDFLGRTTISHYDQGTISLGSLIVWGVGGVWLWTNRRTVQETIVHGLKLFAVCFVLVLVGLKFGALPIIIPLACLVCYGIYRAVKYILF